MLLSQQAVAQDVPLTNIYDYNRNQYASHGAQIGAFEISPVVESALEWNDNIYASEKGQKADSIVTVTPRFSVKSLWSRHGVNGTVSFVDKTYLSNDDESTTSANVSVGGRLDVSSRTKISVQLDLKDTYEARDSIESVNSISPTPYTEKRLNLTLSQRFNRLFVQIKQGVEILDYDDVRLVGGGVLDNDDRDRTTYTLLSRLGYMIVPGYSAFIEGAWDKQKYDSTNPGENRDSSMQAFNVGSQFEVASKVRGDAYVGILTRSYDESNFKDQSTLDFGGSLLWSMTPITSLESKLSKSIEETTDSNTSGYVETSFDLDLQHELRRNILLRLKTELTQLEYNGTSEKADEMSVQVEGKYLFSPRLSATLNVTMKERDSDRVDESFDQSIFKLNVRYSLY